jgi:succinoglycan biosynthesis protein ExoA
MPDEHGRSASLFAPVLRSVQDLPFLSIVMPVRNEEAHLEGVLNQLSLQDYPHDRFEIIVADGDSTDRTRDIVEDFQRKSPMSVRLIRNPKRLSSAGRNAGAQAARGEYVFFVDGHCVIPSVSLLRDAANLFETNGCDCLCRPQPLTVEGTSRFQSVIAHARATAFGHGTDSTIYNTNHEGTVDPTSAGALYRKDVFSKIGYYDESFDACEDVEFNFRVFKAGLKSWISPKLTILYHPRNNIRGLWKQMMRYGRGRYRFMRKHPDAASLGQLVPALFVLWILAGIIGSAVSQTVSLIFGFSVAIYLATALAFSIGLAFRYGLYHLLAAPAGFMTIHMGLGTGFLVQAVSSLRSVLSGENSDQQTSTRESLRRITEAEPPEMSK